MDSWESCEEFPCFTAHGKIDPALVGQTTGHCQHSNVHFNLVCYRDLASQQLSQNDRKKGLLQSSELFPSHRRSFSLRAVAVIHSVIATITIARMISRAMSETATHVMFSAGPVAEGHAIVTRHQPWVNDLRHHFHNWSNAASKWCKKQSGKIFRCGQIALATRSMARFVRQGKNWGHKPRGG